VDLKSITSNTSIGSGGSGSNNLTFPYNTGIRTEYYIKVTSNANPAGNDTSDAPFSIVSAITVVAPNGGENWQRNSLQPIRGCSSQ